MLVQVKNFANYSHKVANKVANKVVNKVANKEVIKH